MNLLIHLSIYLSLSPLPPHACIHIYIYIYIYVCVCVCVCVCVLKVGRDTKGKGY